MAHQDDFEFTAAGAFALLREAHGKDIDLKVVATTRGASGHHISGLEETFRRREAEAKKSASIIGAEYECLTCLDGSHSHLQFFVNRNTLGGLWNAIRQFEPDYIFCPPVITDPLAGIHIDHYNTAWAVRMVAYQLSVPHAYPAINRPANNKKGKSPVIINVDDGYAETADWHINLDLTSVYNQKKLPMLLSHESQIFEWIPWNFTKSKPTKKKSVEWIKQKDKLLNMRYGFNDNTPREFFRFTHWGADPKEANIKKLFTKYQVSESGAKFMKTR
jgi:LmbE family N-acetylglucosaminyl deacetylase